MQMKSCVIAYIWGWWRACSILIFDEKSPLTLFLNFFFILSAPNPSRKMFIRSLSCLVHLDILQFLSCLDFVVDLVKCFGFSDVCSRLRPNWSSWNPHNTFYFLRERHHIWYCSATVWMQPYLNTLFRRSLITCTVPTNLYESSYWSYFGLFHE